MFCYANHTACIVHETACRHTCPGSSYATCMNEQPFPPPDDDEPLDIFPIRPWLRRTAIIVYIVIAICVIIGLLATFFPWGDLSLPFDPPPPFRKNI